MCREFDLVVYGRSVLNCDGEEVEAWTMCGAERFLWVVMSKLTGPT